MECDQVDGLEWDQVIQVSVPTWWQEVHFHRLRVALCTQVILTVHLHPATQAPQNNVSFTIQDQTSVLISDSLPGRLFPPVFDHLQYAGGRPGRSGLDLVYLTSPPMTRSPRPSPSVFAYCNKHSKTGGGSGLGTRLGLLCSHHLHIVTTVFTITS